MREILRQETGVGRTYLGSSGSQLTHAELKKPKEQKLVFLLSVCAVGKSQKCISILSSALTLCLAILLQSNYAAFPINNSYK